MRSPILIIHIYTGVVGLLSGGWRDVVYAAYSFGFAADEITVLITRSQC